MGGEKAPRTPWTLSMAPKVLNILINYAKKPDSYITYGEIAKKIKCHHRSVRYPLWFLRDELCCRNGLPMINLLAVNKQTREPGDGSFDSLKYKCASSRIKDPEKRLKA